MKRAFVLSILMAMAAGAAMGQAITVLAPNGGESWALRSTQRIAWQTTETSGSVRILLFKGTVSLGVIQDNVPITAGVIDWIVGQYRGGEAVPGTDYKVRIRKMLADVWDASNHAFAITPPVVQPGPASITVDAPNGGETWWRDVAYEIRWTPVNILGNVTVKLMRSGIAVQTWSTANTGSCLWMCAGVPDGTDYRVRIENAGATIFDQSDREFEIKTRSVSPPPEKPSIGTVQAIQVAAEVKLPPRLTDFKVNGGASESADLHVAFNYRSLGGGAATHYRYKIQRDYWEDWQPVVAGQTPSGSLLLDECAPNIYFQLKNSYGESNVLNDGIIYSGYKTVRKIGIRQAMEWAGPKGFTTGVLRQDCSDDCAIVMPYTDGYAFELGFNSLQHKGNNLKGMKADYELFGGGKLLKPGWEFVSYEMAEIVSVGNPNAPEAWGGRTILMPAVGSRDIKLQVHLWRNFLAPTVSYLIRSITLKGPCHQHISQAFDQE